MRKTEKPDDGAAKVDAYLARLPKDKRQALTKLRTMIRAAAPKATEGISYGIPMIKQNGQVVVFYSTATAHCTFHVISSPVLRAHAAQLRAYKLGKGSIQFPPDEPLPAALVAKLVKARLAEVAP